jgi:YVTN family beta-propeller protein
MSDQLTSGTATVMFTDVESSTDITTRLGDEAAASLLATHNTIVLDQVAAFRGDDVRSTGDGFLVVFDSARAAVSCALAIQRELTEREHPIRVRIGLNAGEVLHRGDELFGAAINLAARVMDRADGGQILTTDTVRQLVGTMTGTSFRDRGRVALKGFAERQRLWEVRRAEATPAKAPAIGRPSRRTRRTRIAAGAVVLLAAAAAAAALLDGGPGSARAVAVAPNSVAVIDPGKDAIVATIPVGENPGPISAGAGGIWVLNQNSATLSHIDVATRKLVETKGIGGSPAGGGVPGSVAASAHDVWLNAAGCNGQQPGAILHVVAGGEGGRDLASGDRVRVAGAVPAHPSSIEGGGCGLAAQGSTVWAATNGPDGLVRIDYDPVAGRSHVVWGRPLPAAYAMALGHGSLWGIDPASQLVMRIDPSLGRRVRDVRPGSDPTAIASSAAALWVANAGDNSVSRIDPETSLVAQTVGVGQGPTAIATGAGAIWVALADDGAVARIDPRTNRVTATIRVGHRPQGLVVAGGMVWVAVRA